MAAFRKSFLLLVWGTLGKGALFVTPPLADGLTLLTGSSTLAGKSCTEIEISRTELFNIIYLA